MPADWYYPDTEQPPARLIYLQHGFLASGPMYSYTAAYLAEGTNSIVVAPSLTSNPFAEDAFWLGGDGMHRAVAWSPGFRSPRALRPFRRWPSRG